MTLQPREPPSATTRTTGAVTHTHTPCWPPTNTRELTVWAAHPRQKKTAVLRVQETLEYCECWRKREESSARFGQCQWCPGSLLLSFLARQCPCPYLWIRSDRPSLGMSLSFWVTVLSRWPWKVLRVAVRKSYDASVSPCASVLHFLIPGVVSDSDPGISRRKSNSPSRRSGKKISPLWL